MTVKLGNKEWLDPVIVDMMGRELGALSMKPVDGGLIGTFNFKGHAPGIYLLKVSDRKGKLITNRIVKK